MNRRFTPDHIITVADMPDRYRLITRVEAAGQFGRSPATLARWIADGRLPTVRIVRRVLIRESTFRDYLDASNPDQPIADPVNLAPVIDRYLTMNHAAELLGIHRNTVAKLVRSGDLTSVTFGHFRYVTVRSLIALIDSHTMPATTGPLSWGLV